MRERKIRCEERGGGDMEAGKELQSEKEGEVDGRSAEGELEVERTTEEACNEEERCEEDASESHSPAKRARISSVLFDSQEAAILEFIKQHPKLFDKEHERFHYRHTIEALWSEYSEPGTHRCQALV